MGTGAANKALAQRIETMWETLASTHRAWDILQPVLDGGRSRSKLMGQLYDLWIDTRYDINEIRRRQNDVDISSLVSEYMDVYSKRGRGQNTVKYTEAYLRYLFPIDTPVLASAVTPEFITKRLYEYPAKENTIRIVHTTWSGFFDYLVMPKNILQSNPMLQVPKPAQTGKPIRFYEIADVMRIIGAQDTLEKRAVFALIYGTGLELSTVVGGENAEPLRRSDFNEATHEVRSAGTKTGSRDRIALVADWAWPIVKEYLSQFLPNVPLFNRHRSTLSHWHLDTVKALNLPKYPLHNARHHWAVRQLRAGTPVKVVQSQLGHSTSKITMDVYGRFIPDGVDRAKWEKEATKYDEEKQRVVR